mgnify:CR=1 FL=1
MKKDEKKVTSFRPLSGSYILNPVAVLDRDSDTGFPSPLGELYFLICKPNHIDHSFWSFRPLSGSYIS